MADGSVSIRIPPEKGYGLTLDCDLSKIQDEAQAALFCSKIASVRALVQVRLPTQTNEPSARLPSRDQESDASFSLSLSLSLSIGHAFHFLGTKREYPCARSSPTCSRASPWRRRLAVCR